MNNLITINPLFGPALYRVFDNQVFVLMPFEDNLTEIYKNIIKPLIQSPRFNLICHRADEINSNGSIMKDIWKSICEARVILADLTNRNPNVMYELGIAHTLGKETILISQENDSFKLPFDLSQIRTIIYENSATGGKYLEEKLAKTLENILSPRFNL